MRLNWTTIYTLLIALMFSACASDGKEGSGTEGNTTDEKDKMGYDLAYTFQPGHFHIVKTHRTENIKEMPGTRQETDLVTTIDMVKRYEFKKMDDNNVASFNLRFTTVKVEFLGSDGEWIYNSKGEGGTQYANGWEAYAGKFLKFKMNCGTGEITEVTGGKELFGAMDVTMAERGDAFLKAMIARDMHVLPSGKVAVGDSWNRESGDLYDFSLNAQHKYSLASVEGDKVIIKRASTFNPAETPTPNYKRGVKNKYTFNGTSNDEIELSWKTGLPKRMLYHEILKGKISGKPCEKCDEKAFDAHIDVVESSQVTSS
ncbi:MAG: DUF6263 family protein [Bacteroidota bacterium]